MSKLRVVLLAYVVSLYKSSKAHLKIGTLGLSPALTKVPKLYLRSYSIGKSRPKKSLCKFTSTPKSRYWQRNVEGQTWHCSSYRTCDHFDASQLQYDDKTENSYVYSTVLHGWARCSIVLWGNALINCRILRFEMAQLGSSHSLRDALAIPCLLFVIRVRT